MGFLLSGARLGSMSFPPHRGAMPSKLITHFEKDRVLLGERAERFELIAPSVNRADQAEADLVRAGHRSLGFLISK